MDESSYPGTVGGINFSKEFFQLPRTPKALKKYQAEVYDYLSAEKSRRDLARTNREPFKTFMEELTPFALYCDWAYGDREDVLCSLLPGTGAGDAVIVNRDNGDRHIIEITWPIDGRQAAAERKELSEQGHTIGIFSIDQPLIEELDRIREIAEKKQLRDYSIEGRSTLLFVLADFPHYFDSRENHRLLLLDLVEDLKRMEFKVDDGVLLLFNSQRIIPIFP